MNFGPWEGVAGEALGGSAFTVTVRRVVCRLIPAAEATPPQLLGFREGRGYLAPCPRMSRIRVVAMYEGCGQGPVPQTLPRLASLDQMPRSARSAGAIHQFRSSALAVISN